MAKTLVTQTPVLCVCALILALSGALAGCVARSHRENAALSMPWPQSPPAGIAAGAHPNGAYPTVGGDVLKGSSLADLAAARAAAGAPLDAPDTAGKP